MYGIKANITETPVKIMRQIPRCQVLWPRSGSGMPRRLWKVIGEAQKSVRNEVV